MVALPLRANDLLRGDATVNITSDTAVNAKNIAFDEACRQVLSDSLSHYADAYFLQQAIKDIPSSRLAGMVSSSSIGNELSSNTTYSAKISIVYDVSAVRDWLSENEIQNWLPDTSSQDLFPVILETTDKIPDWTEINEIVRAENIPIYPQHISGKIINLVLPVEHRGKFTIALREHGWKYSDNDGVLRIWK